MAKYVSLISWTEQGIKSYQDSVARAEDAMKVAADMGGSLQVLWTLGEYDIVAISDFPDDETATAFMLKVGSQGNIRTKTMRAFESDDVHRIVGMG
ncbi:MAG TPA: GYD domain-containing protein [Actinomycetota bacterium]